MLKILVPTDYSPEAKNACLYAYHFAKFTQSSLVLYHAMPAVIPISDIPYENYYLDEEEELHLLEDTFIQLLKQHLLDPNEIKFEVKIDIQNVISNGINQAFLDNKCDMVIMGTHGASGFRKVFLGSNTAQFIANHRIPVIAIPKEYRFEPIYHMVYSSDLQNLTEELGVLVPFAEVFHAALEIFYFDYAGPDSEKYILDAQQYIFEHNYKNIKLSIQKGNIHLSISENLKRQLNTSNTQMLIMYRAEHSWLDKLLLGSNSQKMVLDAGLPMLVLHKALGV
ncbi:MAG: universal stress protein [Bacteroidia bacterium]|nr:universal stress protein [Bacteroidia bacterium]MCF8425090.1 universal stress protein [Bacteroidia bacterium]MCF8446623.1 universal stress protein [Bacteroidia bacterium]